MIYTKAENSKKLDVPFDARELFKSTNIEQILITLKPGDEIAKHNPPFAANFYVIAGEGYFFGQDSELKLYPGIFIALSENVQRAFKNTGSIDLKILVTKIL